MTQFEVGDVDSTDPSRVSTSVRQELGRMVSSLQAGTAVAEFDPYGATEKKITRYEYFRGSTKSFLSVST